MLGQSTGGGLQLGTAGLGGGGLKLGAGLGQGVSVFKHAPLALKVHTTPDYIYMCRRGCRCLATPFQLTLPCCHRFGSRGCVNFHGYGWTATWRSWYWNWTGTRTDWGIGNCNWNWIVTRRIRDVARYASWAEHGDYIIIQITECCVLTSPL